MSEPSVEQETQPVTVTNPETGSVLFPHGEYTAVRTGEVDRSGEVVVKITPSFRPGMPYDLSSYPSEWVLDATPAR